MRAFRHLIVEKIVDARRSKRHVNISETSDYSTVQTLVTTVQNTCRISIYLK